VNHQTLYSVEGAGIFLNYYQAYPYLDDMFCHRSMMFIYLFDWHVYILAGKDILNQLQLYKSYIYMYGVVK